MRKILFAFLLLALLGAGCSSGKKSQASADATAPVVKVQTDEAAQVQPTEPVPQEEKADAARPEIAAPLPAPSTPPKKASAASKPKEEQKTQPEIPAAESPSVTIDNIKKTGDGVKDRIFIYWPSQYEVEWTVPKSAACKMYGFFSDVSAGWPIVDWREVKESGKLLITNLPDPKITDLRNYLYDIECSVGDKNLSDGVMFQILEDDK